MAADRSANSDLATNLNAALGLQAKARSPSRGAAKRSGAWREAAQGLKKAMAADAWPAAGRRDYPGGSGCGLR
jgi:hypothetical protein